MWATAVVDAVDVTFAAKRISIPSGGTCAATAVAIHSGVPAAVEVIIAVPFSPSIQGRPRKKKVRAIIPTTGDVLIDSSVNYSR